MFTQRTHLNANSLLNVCKFNLKKYSFAEMKAKHWSVKQAVSYVHSKILIRFCNDGILDEQSMTFYPKSHFSWCFFTLIGNKQLHIENRSVWMCLELSLFDFKSFADILQDAKQRENEICTFSFCVQAHFEFECIMNADLRLELRKFWPSSWFIPCIEIQSHSFEIVFVWHFR